MRFYNFLAPTLADSPSGIKPCRLEGLQWETQCSCSAASPTTRYCCATLCAAQLHFNTPILLLLMSHLSEKKTWNQFTVFHNTQWAHHGPEHQGRTRATVWNLVICETRMLPPLSALCKTDFFSVSWLILPTFSQTHCPAKCMLLCKDSCHQALYLEMTFAKRSNTRISGYPTLCFTPSLHFICR